MSKDNLLIGFKDILELRKANNDAVSFMMRVWNPQPAYKVSKYLSPSELKVMVYNSKRLKKNLKELAIVLNQSEESFNKTVHSMLEEIGLDRKMMVVRLLGLFTTKVLCRLWSNIMVNDMKFLEVKSTLGQNPVVFVPTHRSYADFILMTYLCFYFDIELPAVATGMDFHSMVGMGRVMRDTCAFYIRRTFTSDKLYSAVFREYVRTLVTNYHAPLSFFIEGTRSRSGKSMSPKYGFMSMVLEPLFLSEVPDVTFIPVSLSYDRVLEERLFAFELLGVPKPKESTSGLFKAASILNENFGNIYVNVGTPMSAKDYFGTAMKRVVHSIKPVDIQNLTPSENKLIQKLSHEIVSRQQSITILTTFQLVAAIVSASLQDNDLLSFDVLCSKVIWISDILKTFGGNTFDYNKDNVEEEIKLSLNVHKNLIVVDKNNMLRLVNSAPVLVTEEITKKMKGHQLCEKTMSSVIPFVMLQLYVNPVLFCVIPPSIIYLIINKTQLKEDKLWEEYTNVRTLLKNEFPINDPTLYDEFQKCLSKLQMLDVISKNDEEIITLGNNKDCQELFQVFLWPFLDCLYRTGCVISKQKSIEEKLLLKHVQESVESQLLNQADTHPYSLSLDAIANCVQGFVADHSVTKERKETGIIYYVNENKVLTTTKRIEELRKCINFSFNIQNPIIQQNVLSRL